MYVCVWECMCACVASLSSFFSPSFCVVVLFSWSFDQIDGSETLIKINIIGFSLHLTYRFFPPVCSCFPIHSLGCLELEAFVLFQGNPHAIWVLHHIICITLHLLYVIVNILPSTEQENNLAQPKNYKWISFPSHFWLFFLEFYHLNFNSCLSVVLQLDKGNYPTPPTKFADCVFCPNKKPSSEPFMCLDLIQNW